MAATTGFMKAIGTKSGRSYMVQLYVPDAVAGKIGFALNGTAGAGSDTLLRIDEQIQILDIAILAAPTATTVAFAVNGAQFSGNTILLGAHLYNTNTRPVPGWVINGGTNISAVNG